MFLDPNHMRKDISEEGVGLKADKTAIQADAMECLRQLAVWSDQAGRVLLEKDPAAMAALRALATEEGKALTPESKRTAGKALLAITGITFEPKDFEIQLKQLMLGDKGARRVAYTQIDQTVLSGDLGATMELAKACVAPLVHGVLCAAASWVDAAEARQAYVLLGKLILLDPLQVRLFGASLPRPIQTIQV